MTDMRVDRTLDRSGLGDPVNLPSPGADELDPAPAMVMAECGRGGGGGASRRLAQTLDRIGVLVVLWCTVNLVMRAPAPHLFILRWRQGPTNHGLVGRPRSGRESGARSTRWARTGERST